MKLSLLDWLFSFDWLDFRMYKSRRKTLKTMQTVNDGGPCGTSAAGVVRSSGKRYQLKTQQPEQTRSERTDNKYGNY
jgi:hypothetical protein